MKIPDIDSQYATKRHPTTSKVYSFPSNGKEPLSWFHIARPIAATEERDDRIADFRETKADNDILAQVLPQTCRISPLWLLWIDLLVHNRVNYPCSLH